MKSYYLYQKYQSIGGGSPSPVYPLEFSMDGDGTMPLVVKSNNDPNCGDTPDPTALYRWVNLPISEGYVCDDCGSQPTPYEEQYLTIESLEDGNVIEFGSYDMGAMTISASTDNGQTWSAFTANDSNVTIATINTGDKILFKGLNERYYPIEGFGSNMGSFITTNSREFNVYGNIMSLLYGDDFVNKTSLSGKDYAFMYLFSQSFVTDASNLILPATTLDAYCYDGMFYDCPSLTAAPELPATTLANVCYGSMFYECPSLTAAPALPATTLALSCYDSMFLGCTSLVAAPVLSATTLAEMCYDSMFYGCTSLTTAPELPATTLTYACYQYMFRNCSSLNYVKCLATDISVSGCTNKWLNGVAANGTFVKNPNMSSWTTGESGIPSGWTVQNA